MKRFHKREIVASSVIFGAAIILVIIFASANLASLSPGTEFAPSAGPAGIFNGLPSIFSQSNQLISQNTPVINTSESLVGELDNRDFENVTGQILTNLNSMGGIISSSNLMYNGTTWLGIYSVSVPSRNATMFLFQVKSLVDRYGKTTSVQILTQEVTNATRSNQSAVAYSTFGITLQEMALNSATGHGLSVPPFLQGVWSFLVAILTAAVYIALIGLPLYFLILGGVMVSGRILYPLLQRVSKNSSAKRNDQTVVT